jgi:DNA-directed RNA polymerase specialized sigma24 family protein
MRAADREPDAPTLRRLYAEGYSLRAIAQRFGWSYRTTRRNVQAAGVALRRRGPPPAPLRLTSDDVAVLRRMHAAVGARPLARLLHLDADILQALAAPPTPPAAPAAAALDRFAAGMTLDELARQLGCSRRTVQRMLRRARIRLSDASG